VYLSENSYVKYPERRPSGYLRRDGQLQVQIPNWEKYASRNWRPWHGARTSRNAEQHGNYIRLLTSEGVQNRRLGESKGSIAETSTGQQTCLRYEQRTWGIWTPNYSSGCDWLWLTGDYVNTCRLQHCQLTAEKQLQRHATVSFKTFSCAPECKSRYLSYKIYKPK
jgi:hypothetical protein